MLRKVWEPFEELKRIREEIDRMIEEFLKRPREIIERMSISISRRTFNRRLRSKQ
jgi:hypothetical protein